MLFDINTTWTLCVLFQTAYDQISLTQCFSNWSTIDMLLNNIFQSCLMHEKPMLCTQITLWCEQMWGELEIPLKSACLISNKHSWTNTLGEKIPKRHLLLNKIKICLGKCPRKNKNEIYVFICSYMKRVIQSEGGCAAAQNNEAILNWKQVSNCYRHL